MKNKVVLDDLFKKSCEHSDLEEAKFFYYVRKGGTRDLIRIHLASGILICRRNS